MSQPIQKLQRFFRELKRRNVYKVAVAYLVVAFVGLQAAQLLVPATTLPAWADDFLIYVAVFGFPLALVIAWAFEVTPEGVRRTTAAEPEEREAAGPGTRTAYKVLVGLGLVGAAVAGGWYLTGGGGGGSEISERTVAVVPFQVSGSGTEEWREGMVTMLGTGLDGAAGLRAIPDQTVLAAWERADKPAGGAAAPRFLTAARDVGAQYAVVGSAVKLGGELRLSADVHETGSGERLGQVEVRGSPERMTSLTDSLTRRVLTVLLEEGQEDLPSVSIGDLTTSSLPALKSYLRGEQHFRAGEYEAAIEDYEAAVSEDSTFALAYARLARSHGWLVEGRRKYWRQADQYSDRLSDRERGIVRSEYMQSVEGHHMAAADTLRRLTDQYPDDPTIWYSLGETLFHGNIPRGWPEAETAFERAVALDPGVSAYHHHFVDLAFAVHHDSALAARRIEAHPDGTYKRLYRLTWDVVFGSAPRREEALARLDTTSIPGRAFPPGFALRHPADGRLDEQVFRRIQRRDDYGDQRFATQIAGAKLRQGQLDGALAVIAERPSADDRQACMIAFHASLGLPFPDSVVRRYLEPDNLPDTASAGRLRCAALYLIEQGRSQAASKLIARFRATADTSDIQQPLVDRAMRELRGYRAWKAGNLDRAAELLSGFNLASEAGAIWRGDLYRELGQRKRAEGWYLAAWIEPVAHERLGQLYVDMDKPEKAAEAYRRFIAAWEDADEELQPRVEEARKRLQPLTASEAEPDE